MTDEKKASSTREIIAVVISGAMVLTSIVYWIIQIQSVMELLRLAGE